MGPDDRSVFVSAYVKRHSGLNDTYGADAIYLLKPDTNATTHWVDLGDHRAIDVGQSTIPTNAARDMTGSTLQSADPIFAEVGKYGIGDIETNGADTLYVTNLFQRTVHAIPIPADGSAPTTSSTLGMPGSAVTCTNGTARPFALAYQDGYVYSGLVCDAATGTTADLDAYVVRTTGDGTLDPGGPQGSTSTTNKGAVYTRSTSPTRPRFSTSGTSGTTRLTRRGTWATNSSATRTRRLIVRPTPDVLRHRVR